MCRPFYGFFVIPIIISLASKNNNINFTEIELNICHSIDFKPKYIKCNSNNVLYIDLSLVADEENNSHFYRINLYKNFDIKAV